MAFRLLKALALGCGLVLVGAPAYVVTNLGDPPFDDSHLRIERVALAAGEDAFARLDALGALVDSEALEAVGDRCTEAEDAQATRRVLEAHEGVLREVDEILAGARFQRRIADEIEPGSGWVPIGKLLRARAIHRARSGDREGAFRDVNRAIGMGQRMSTAHGGALITAIFGYGMMHDGSAALRSSLAILDVDPTTARFWLGALPADPAPQSAWRTAWEGEYEWVRRALDDLATQPREEGIDYHEASPFQRLLPVRYLYKSETTARALAQRFARESARAEVPCQEIPGAESDPGPPNLTGTLGPNGIGRRLFPSNAFDGEPLRFDREARELRSVGWPGGPVGDDEKPPSWPIAWESRPTG